MEVKAWKELKKRAEKSDDRPYKQEQEKSEQELQFIREQIDIILMDLPKHRIN